MRDERFDELVERFLVATCKPCQNERSDQRDRLSDRLPQLRRSVLERERDDLIVICCPKLLAHFGCGAGEGFERYSARLIRINRCHESIQSDMLDMDIAQYPK